LALTGQTGDFSYAPVTDVPWLHPGRAATLWRGERCVGHIGHLHPALLRALDIDHEVIVFELAVDGLSGRNIPTAGNLSRQPSVRRDLAILVADEVSWARIEASLRKALGAVLRDVLAFDVYRGKGVADGSRSIAIGLILQDDSRTLAESDVEHCVAMAITALQQDCGAVLRG
jgi:phenylalanyl-tRNA synthetase beta chain